jgi:predicted small integral membrane protein
MAMILDRLGNLVSSMAWTMPTALFFLAILAMLLAMTAWEFAQPTVERRGFLPMATTRGDRLFIGLLSAAWIHLAWIAGTEAALWGASIVAAIWFLVVMRFG